MTITTQQIELLQSSFFDAKKGTQTYLDTFYMVNQIALCVELVALGELLVKAEKELRAPLFDDSQGGESLPNWYNGYSCAFKKFMGFIVDAYRDTEVKSEEPSTLGED